MLKPNYSRFLLACLALLFASSALAQSRRGFVRLTRIGPTVKVEDNATGQEVMRLENVPSEEIKILDKSTVITTGTDSRVILVFSNGATLNVKENTTLNIQEFRQDPFAGSYDMKTATNEPDADSRTEIFLKEGELIGNVKTLRENSVFNVSTPAGAAGIRGTTFRVVFRPQGNGQAFFTVTTLEGDVGVTTTQGTVDVPISVVDDQEVVIVVQVDDATGAVTVVTPVEQIAATTADATVLASMSDAVQQTVEAVVSIIMTAETDQDSEPAADGDTGNTGGDEPTPEPESNEPDEPEPTPENDSTPEQTPAETTTPASENSGTTTPPTTETTPPATTPPTTTPPTTTPPKTTPPPTSIPGRQTPTTGGG